MAQPCPILTGQVASYCQYCETEKKIQYKCLECTLLLCKQCKRNHHKIKSAQNHHIVDISEVGQHDLILDLGSIPCDGHSGQICCLFCKTCDKLVCPICVAKIHKRHDMIEIKEAYTMKKELLMKRSEHADQQCLDAKTEEKHNPDLKEQMIKKIGKTREEILDNEKKLKSKVENLTKKLLDNLENAAVNASQYLDEYSTDLKQYQSKIEAKNMEKETLVATLNGSEFFQNIDGLMKSYDDIKNPKTSSRFPTNFHFKPHELTTIGEVLIKDVDSDNRSFGLTDVKEYTGDLKMTSHILPYKEDNLFIYDNGDRVLQKIQLTGNTVKVLSTRSIYINGVASFNDNFLLSTGSSKLQLYDNKTNTMRDSCFDVSPLGPCKPHITKNNKIILGAYNFDYPIPGRRVLIIFDMRGHREATYELDANSQLMFAFPRYLTSTANGYIQVSDWDYINEPKGRVIVLDQKGEIITRYNGHPEVNSKLTFQPYDIVTLPNDTVAVADRSTHHLHMLNNRGVLLTLCNTAEKGILLPISLAVYNSKCLYIGCSRYKNKEKNQRKLYKAELMIL